ncbi:MAG: hypothetical protein HRT68_13540, partial [Flavobacteriaceae bacterium]|nr:hypothetical protein [Flavobacteriaceae bacterium]
MMLLITRIITMMALVLCTTILSAQERQSQEISEQQQEQIERMTQQEKDKLRRRVETINRKLDNYEITLEEASKLKKEAAEEAARRIEQKATDIANGKESVSGGYAIELGIGPIIALRNNDTIRLHRKKDKRTYSDIVIAVGFNNAIQEGRSLDNSDYKFAGSRFFELGYAWRTRVFKESNFLRFKYGISLQYNSLKPTDNRYFVRNGDVTTLETFPENLDKSKIRFTNLVAPIHFEFGPSKKIEREHYFRYSTRKKFKIGVGGYGGFRIGTKQKLKFSMDGDDKKEKIKNSYNASNLVYGLSGYIAWGGVGLYAKYDLNPLFES